jgi:hypothetical protein
MKICVIQKIKLSRSKNRRNQTKPNIFVSICGVAKTILFFSRTILNWHVCLMVSNLTVFLLAVVSYYGREKKVVSIGVLTLAYNISSQNK